MLNENTKKVLKRQQYGLAGRHSAVKICHWTKEKLRGKGHCYKEKFYGVDSHKCAEITPTVLWCNNRCVFCWRPTEYMKLNDKLDDDPQKIVSDILEERKKLLMGFKGNKNVDKELLKDALIPNHWAISLSGEPCLYEKLPDLINLLKKKYKARTVYLVTNGLVPDMLQKLVEKNSLPTQLYISVSAPNKTKFKKISRSLEKDYWEKYQKSLKIMASLRGKIHTVLRMTLIKSINMSDEDVKGYWELIETAEPEFIEAKAYMFVGFSRERLKKENMPYHKDIVEFSKKLEEHPKIKMENEMKPSRIVLLKYYK